ncbi:hypothetical protein PV08_01053 [Exophiala spinifera]|uniref:Xylanolytic transcriptional activator regulatory domain-containing protein n=1 Tax=Exophiala spinifera TaxID=91928 RepID=A0A0D2BNJ5_9EURO|nr:uncharacterized protein PV08_01053 [Exophiala spinifera]KIW20478.1 hypothetical protein PV08_01053 [Exophiala spinifera]
MGLFNEEEPPNYASLRQQDFDWHDWIYRESRRRLACQVFCLDMAGCVFRSRAPALSPLSFKVLLPSYESAWQAKSKSECWHQLRATSQPLTVSYAFSRLWGAAADNFVGLEVSGYGMFTLIEGLHGCIFNMTREEMLFATWEDNTAPSTNLFQTTAATMVKQLQSSLTAETIDAIADGFIGTYGGKTFTRLNSALNAWRQCWQSRVFRDLQNDGNNFLCDPLPFWHLAKLLLMLRLARVAGAEEPMLALLKVRHGPMWDRSFAQDGVLSWLRRLWPSRGEDTAFETSEYAGSETNCVESLLTVLLRPT